MSHNPTAPTPNPNELLGFSLPPEPTGRGIGPVPTVPPRGYANRVQVSGVNRVLIDTFQQTEVAPSDESGMSLVRYGMTEEFTGGVTGTGTASHVSIARKDGTTTFTGIERITGAVDGRTGSFVITDAGYHDRHNMAHGRWTVVAGSATGELAGLRGEGSFAVTIDGPDGPLSIYDLTYWFADEEPDTDAD